MLIVNKSNILKLIRNQNNVPEFATYSNHFYTHYTNSINTINNSYLSVWCPNGSPYGFLLETPNRGKLSYKEFQSDNDFRPGPQTYGAETW